MAWTFTDYLRTLHLAPPALELAALVGANGLVEEWIGWVSDGYLAGIPSPGRQPAILAFQNQARSRAAAFAQAGSGAIATAQELDEVARTFLERGERALVDGTPVAGPIIPTDAEYLTPGVKCIGTLVGVDGMASVGWMNRAAYSGNHGRARANEYLAGGGAQRRGFLRPVPGENQAMLPRAKPGIALLQLLGDARHAEDGWFMTHFTDFVRDANAMVPAVPLPPLAGRTLWQQKATVPRVEFLQSMPPCDQNPQNAQEGCRGYFRELRAAITVPNLPILIYHHRIFEVGQAVNGIHTIATDGSLTVHPNRWVPG